MLTPRIYLYRLFLVSLMPHPLHAQQKEFSALYHPEFLQEVFIKDDLHYLKVSRIRTFKVHNSFGCALKCLSNPFCLSINIAAYKGADGKFWCELLASEKYSNPEEYKRKKSSHHLSIMTPCLSSPCQNGGTCVANHKHKNIECHCKEGFIGKFCETVAASCQAVYDQFPEKLNVTQVVTLLLDSQPTSVLCHFGDFGCRDGGWTPVMKMDGNKQTFHYDAAFWSNKETFNVDGGKTGFDSQETKLPSYWNTSFSKICLGMKIKNQTNFIAINKSASSLHTLIADGQYRNTSLGREAWMSLAGLHASLQLNCNKEGFNAKCSTSNRSKARIGILGNDQMDCRECNSRLGFGSGGNFDNTNTCGNLDNHNGKGLSVKAMGYILVQ